MRIVTELFIVLFIFLGFFSCSVKYDRDNFNYVEFMEGNGDDIAEYLQNNWSIDSAFVFHMGFFKAREWKSIFPEEMQTIFVDENRYNESEYLDEKGFDVNAPLFVVYFSKLKRIEGNAIDDAGINPGSYVTEFSEEGLDAAQGNYESANYSYEDRLYYMALATIVGGEFKLLMCCDIEDFNDEIAFPLYYNTIAKNEKFYPFLIGGGSVRTYEHRKGNLGPYSQARIDFSNFVRNENVAIFAPNSKRKGLSSDFTTKFKGCKKAENSVIKSLDYFFMLYNGDIVKTEIDKAVEGERTKINSKILEIFDQANVYLGSYNYSFPENTEKKNVYDTYYNNDELSDKELVVILSGCRKIMTVVQVAVNIDNKIDAFIESEPRMESYKWSALQDIKQSLKRGFILNNSICQNEGMEEYHDRLKILEMNFDQVLKNKIKELQ